ncbi:uncharacterized protein LOC114314869 [Camellia sinensis]|uniref:uncharacterized protein LOC114314869 n=1 Tax=Camellia sinensis TaxID=4442 RepID=UPI0010363A25|nr:uncharacterized protein LOC114314869 [Camellia sinensis]
MCISTMMVLSLAATLERWPLWDSEIAHLEKGMIFSDKKSLVHVVQLYNLKRNRECKVIESKGNSWVVEWKHDYNWRVQATKLKDKDFFQIRKGLKRRISISPELPLATIIEVMMEKFQFTISYKKTWHARKKAVAMAFKPAIKGFKYCHPVICIDDTHLYGKYEGKIVAATAVTAANKIIPLAFAVVDKKMIKSWGWFITLIRRRVCRDLEGVTLISDRYTTLLSVVSRIWNNPAVQPRGYHRYCLRYVCSNFNKRFGNTVAKDLVWRAGSVRQVRKFNKIIEDIYKLEKNAEWRFSRMNPIHWTLCQLVKYFDEGKIIVENASNWGHLYTSNVQRWINEHQAKANVHMLVPINRETGKYEVRTAPYGMGVVLVK